MGAHMWVHICGCTSRTFRSKTKSFGLSPLVYTLNKRDLPASTTLSRARTWQVRYHLSDSGYYEKGCKEDKYGSTLATMEGLSLLHSSGSTEICEAGQ